jgi:glycosyltransferase involved in cell wall biosynthesis
MTSYNRQDLITFAIESVLASTYKNFELIIVDDGSKDDTVIIAKEYAAKDNRIKVYINEKNLGDYPNRNKAASYANGKYIKYVDSDDMIYPHCLEVMVNSMEKFPEAGFGLCSHPDAQAPYPYSIEPRQIYLEHFNGYGHFFRSPGSAIIKKEAFDKEGGFSGERMIGDTEMWFRLGRKYPLVKLVTGLYFYRMHGNQEQQTDYAKQQYAKLTKKVLDDAMNHKDCPLDVEEKKKILHRLKRENQKKFIKSLIK